MLHNMRHQYKILEKDGKVTVGIFMLYFFRTRLNEAEIANLPFAKDARTFICCPEFYLSLKISSHFAFSISQKSITYILGQSTLCGFVAFAELSRFSDCMVLVSSEKYTQYQ